MNYIDETIKFIESDEMREYLHVYFSKEDDKIWLRNICAEIVSNAPTCVTDKIPVLDLIAEQTKPRPKGDWHDPVWLANFARHALGEEQKGPVGTVFQVRELLYHEPSYYDDYTLYHTFNAAINYIKWIDTECEDIERDDTHKNANYYIEKFIPNDDGKMVATFYWIVNHAGDIWYFGEERYTRDPFRDEFFDYLGNLNLPVPFEPGDIVTADCRPFAKERRVLILSIGDNSDCCSVQCLFTFSIGKLAIGAFKHNRFLKSSHREISHVSVLYRTARYQGELDEYEQPFSKLSAVIKKNPLLGQEIWDYFFENDDGWGLTWEEIKEKFIEDRSK